MLVGDGMSARWREPSTPARGRIVNEWFDAL